MFVTLVTLLQDKTFLLADHMCSQYCVNHGNPNHGDSNPCDVSTIAMNAFNSGVDKYLKSYKYLI